MALKQFAELNCFYENLSNQLKQLLLVHPNNFATAFQLLAITQMDIEPNVEPKEARNIY